ncbi:MAG: phosphonate C-P lyase system protein PhnG, partial [Desulfobulbia bacterium]
MNDTEEGIASRQNWISVLSKSDATLLQKLWADYSCKKACEVVRKPETGLVMVRGRAGGTGNPFNLGEATVTRCSVRSPSG